MAGTSGLDSITVCETVTLQAPSGPIRRNPGNRRPTAPVPQGGTPPAGSGSDKVVDFLRIGRFSHGGLETVFKAEGCFQSRKINIHYKEVVSWFCESTTTSRL